MKPTAAPQGSPVPSTPKPGATKRPRNAAAAALSDVTNLLHPETPTPVRPGRAGRPRPSDASSTCSSASVTPAPKRPPAAGLQEECGVVKSPAISTVYARRVGAQAKRRGNRGTPTTNKGKGKEPAAAAAAAAGTASCPQLGKSARNNNNNNRETSMVQDTRSISSSAPCHEAKKKRPSSSTIKLPEDFVKKQRAYFADVDAFELPEEEVSETEVD